MYVHMYIVFPYKYYKNIKIHCMFVNCVVNGEADESWCLDRVSASNIVGYPPLGGRLTLKGYLRWTVSTAQTTCGLPVFSFLRLRRLCATRRN